MNIKIKGLWEVDTHMKKTLFKRCMCTAIAGIMALSLTACVNSKTPMASKDNVYKSTVLEIPGEFDYIETVKTSTDYIYIIEERSEQIPIDSAQADDTTSVADEESDIEEEYTDVYKTILIIMDYEGNVKKKSRLMTMEMLMFRT